MYSVFYCSAFAVFVCAAFSAAHRSIHVDVRSPWILRLAGLLVVFQLSLSYAVGLLTPVLSLAGGFALTQGFRGQSRLLWLASMSCAVLLVGTFLAVQHETLINPESSDLHLGARISFDGSVKRIVVPFDLISVEKTEVDVEEVAFLAGDGITIGNSSIKIFPDGVLVVSGRGVSIANTVIQCATNSCVILSGAATLQNVSINGVVAGLQGPVDACGAHGVVCAGNYPIPPGVKLPVWISLKSYFPTVVWAAQQCGVFSLKLVSAASTLCRFLAPLVQDVILSILQGTKGQGAPDCYGAPHPLVCEISRYVTNMGIEILQSYVGTSASYVLQLEYGIVETCWEWTTASCAYGFAVLVAVISSVSGQLGDFGVLNVLSATANAYVSFVMTHLQLQFFLMSRLLDLCVQAMDLAWSASGTGINWIWYLWSFYSRSSLLTHVTVVGAQTAYLASVLWLDTPAPEHSRWLSFASTSIRFSTLIKDNGILLYRYAYEHSVAVLLVFGAGFLPLSAPYTLLLQTVLPWQSTKAAMTFFRYSSVRATIVALLVRMLITSVFQHVVGDALSALWREFVNIILAIVIGVVVVTVTAFMTKK